jgi:hypothetical protein
MFVVVLGTWTEDALCSLHEEHGGLAGLQPASQPSRPSQSSLTHAHPPPLRPPTLAPQKPKPRLPKHWQKMFPRSSVLGVYWHDLAGWLLYIYIYISMCVCVFVWARMWCAVAAEPIVCSERPGMNNLWFKICVLSVKTWSTSLRFTQEVLYSRTFKYKKIVIIIKKLIKNILLLLLKRKLL